MTTSAKVSPRIYVADLAAYNAGRLHGVWIEATDELEEINKQVQAMLAGSPEDHAEEYAIHDYEGFGGLSLSEFEGLERVHELALFIDENELGAALLSHFDGDLDEACAALENYAGTHESAADFAQELTEECQQVPENLAHYIDYEAMARDMELSGDIFTIEAGFQEVHIFWSR